MGMMRRMMKGEKVKMNSKEKKRNDEMDENDVP